MNPTLEATSVCVLRSTAAIVGATVEFSKWEGITFDAKRSRLYTSMSEIRAGMEDNAIKGAKNTTFDLGGPNDIRLPYGKCGCGAPLLATGCSQPALLCCMAAAWQSTS
jgi:hypothetical protein